MPIGLINLEWENHNAVRSYPLTDDSSKQDVTGTFTIPDDFLIGASLSVHWGTDVSPTKFYIKRIVADRLGYSITIGYSGTSEFDVATAVISKSAHDAFEAGVYPLENRIYPLAGIGNYFDCWGWLQIGSLANISKQPTGIWNFTLTDTRLEPDAIRPHLRAVTAIQVENGGELSPELTGVVRLQAGRNIRLSVVAGTPPKIVVDAIEGEGLNESCICDSDLPPPIRNINGVRPDDNGRIDIIGTDCLTVEAEGNKIVLGDSCAKPCCGCKDLEPIVAELQRFGEKATTIENFLVGLEARTSQTELVVLGSRLGDRGCSTNCE